MAGKHSIKPDSVFLTSTHTRLAFAAIATGSMFSMVLPGISNAQSGSGLQALASLKTQDNSTSETTDSFAISAKKNSDVTPLAPLDIEVHADNTDLELSVTAAPSPTTQNTQTATNTAVTPPVATQEIPASSASSAVAIGRQYIGTPYKYGGSTPAGFDCSGFVAYVYAQMGYSLPHSSSAIRNAGTVIPASQAQPGDIMWWPGHVAIYTGSSQIEAVTYGTPLSENPVRPGATFIRVS